MKGAPIHNVANYTKENYLLITIACIASALVSV